MRPPLKRREIKQTIVRWIFERGLKPGDKLDGQNALAAFFETTPVTVVRALNELASEGVIHRINGSGTFVGPPGGKTLREFCLVLPEPNMGTPERNPEFWHHVQTMQSAFMEAAGTNRLFSVRIVPEHIAPATAASSFQHYEAVFFHFASRPEAFLQYLIEQQSVPVVVFGQPAPELSCLTIDHCPQREANLAVEFLIDRGYRNIALVRDRADWCDAHETGYRAALRKANIRFSANRVLHVSSFSHLGAERAAQQLLDSGIKCDAIFCCSDILAYGIIEWMRHAGIKVPDDLGVMGFEGIRALTQHDPYLTTVAIPYHKEISDALELLAKRKVRHAPIQHIATVGRIVEGLTTRATRANADR